MTRKIEINLEFTEPDEYVGKSNCSISINADGKEQDIVTMNDKLKSLCVIVMRHAADVLEEEIYK